MSIEVIAAIFAGLVSLITAMGAAIIVVVNGIKSRQDAIRKDDKLEEIHALVNSRLTEALKEITELRGYITELHKGSSPVSPKTFI